MKIKPTRSSPSQVIDPPPKALTHYSFIHSIYQNQLITIATLTHKPNILSPSLYINVFLHDS